MRDSMENIIKFCYTCLIKSFQKSYKGVWIVLFLTLSFLSYPHKCIADDTSQTPIDFTFTGPDAGLINDDIKLQKYTEAYKKLETNQRYEVEEILNYGISNGLYSTYKQFLGADSMTKKHFSDYCTDGIDPTCTEKRDPLLAEGDIKFSTFVSGPMLNKSRKDASDFFIQNFIQPFPSTQFQGPKVNPNSPDFDSDSYSKLLAQQSLLSVAREPFAEMVAKRTATVDVPALKQDPKTGHVTNDDKETTSMMLKMENAASEQFLNQDWYKTLMEAQFAITKSPATALSLDQIMKMDRDKALDDKTRVLLYALQPLFDIAKMNATRTWIEYERYKQGERIEALLAGILAQLNQQATSAEALTKGMQGKPGG